MSKRVRCFDPSSTGLDHVLVSHVLPQISAGLFDCRWQADGIPDLCSWLLRGSLSDVYGLLHFSLVPVRFTGQYFSVLHGH